ncbi:MAG TPA: NUDIX hydrolase [Candidatus Saccharimonadales bacterium]|nr:NUDIX hydrolase [Candidatus Saccharimonadales bacterium]
MEVIVQPGVTYTKAEVERSALFRRWAARLGPEWRGRVWVTGVQAWDDHRKVKQIQIIQGFAQAFDDPWPKGFTLLPHTVDVLVKVKSGWFWSWVVFVRQYRPAVGAWVYSNVAGFCNLGEPLLHAVQEEARQELGLADLGDHTISRLLKGAVFSSPGLTGEETHFFLLVLQIPRKEIRAFLGRLHNKETGIASEGEVLKTHVVPARKAWRFIAKQQPASDEKTLHSLSLAGLRR